MMARNTAPASMPIEDAIVVVQSEWNGWRTARVRVAHLEKLHWAQPAGAPRPLLHALVSCTQLQSGHLAHHCEASAPPHDLLVCVLKSHTQSAVFAELSRRADAAAPEIGTRVRPPLIAVTPSRSSPRAHST
jgi:hypothetical protein